ncbi:hypothetical protein FEK34_28320 [Nocardia cyriacigeorgica]|uniref:Uncharacterized protein n=1 Tax=Nocardia cyriacigeorgica TaxID=135487 RepID=A0A5R8NB94_9NOCA|nr:hypothetical protein FEK34_28320 [Nocardia cyriacigeorgica]
MHTVTVADGVEGLYIGQNGFGNAWLGTRIGTTVRDWGWLDDVRPVRLVEVEPLLRIERTQTMVPGRRFAPGHGSGSHSR